MKKFNDGDKVVSLNNVQHWNNPYHQKGFINNFIKIVKHSNDEMFTTDRSIKSFEGISHKSMTALSVNYQNGSCLSYEHREYHLYNLNDEHDKAHVLSKFNELFEKADQEAKKNQENRISEIENEILALQRRLERVKAGKHERSDDSMSEIQKNEEYKQAILSRIHSV